MTNIHQQLRTSGAALALGLCVFAPLACGGELQEDPGLEQDETSSPITSVSPPAGVAIRSFTANGSGCPIGSATNVTLSADRSTFQFTNDPMIASATSSRRIDYKFCQFSIIVDVPAGFSYSLQRATYDGHEAVGANASGVHSVGYYFAGGFGPTFTTNVTGPSTQNFAVDHSFPDAEQVWSTCGGAGDILNVKWTARGIVRGQAGSEIGIDRLGAFHIRYRACP